MVYPVSCTAVCYVTVITLFIEKVEVVRTNLGGGGVRTPLTPQWLRRCGPLDTDPLSLPSRRHCSSLGTKQQVRRLLPWALLLTIHRTTATACQQTVVSGSSDVLCGAPVLHCIHCGCKLESRNHGAWIITPHLNLVHFSLCPCGRLKRLSVIF